VRRAARGEVNVCTEREGSQGGGFPSKKKNYRSNELRSQLGALFQSSRGEVREGRIDLVVLGGEMREKTTKELRKLEKKKHYFKSDGREKEKHYY